MTYPSQAFIATDMLACPAPAMRRIKLGALQGEAPDRSLQASAVAEQAAAGAYEGSPRTCFMMASVTLSRVVSSSTKRCPCLLSRMAPQPRSFSGASHCRGSEGAQEQRRHTEAARGHGSSRGTHDTAGQHIQVRKAVKNSEGALDTASKRVHNHTAEGHKAGGRTVGHGGGCRAVISSRHALSQSASAVGADAHSRGGAVMVKHHWRDSQATLLLTFVPAVGSAGSTKPVGWICMQTHQQAVQGQSHMSVCMLRSMLPTVDLTVMPWTQTTSPAQTSPTALGTKATLTPGKEGQHGSCTRRPATRLRTTQLVPSTHQHCAPTCTCSMPTSAAPSPVPS